MGYDNKSNSSSLRNLNPWVNIKTEFNCDKNNYLFGFAVM